ncbi:ribonuclease P protein component [Hydrogenovibrio sp. JE_KL2]|uniref:ribonuclease P protein component n=1 Tax=Hydrogenovibrio sp. JE_KL2 TaxID=2651188 RepID=UPI00128C4DB4|nr:ribonuclease P protein component [Hydrogenovibrio sp. JE_KL2]MPQ76517.1 ribonuclease P protein component [Hydrogenovibrio sp. JE_KL2]
MIEKRHNSDELNTDSDEPQGLTHQNFPPPEDSETLSEQDLQNLNNPALFDLSLNTFPKAFRLLTPKDFQHVFADAEKFANRHWTLIVRPNQKPYPRMGLAIAKKQLNRAVWRNRIKRLARELFRQHKQALSGYDIVVLSRRGMQEIDNVTLNKSFMHLIRKISSSGLKDGVIRPAPKRRPPANDSRKKHEPKG